MQFKYDIFLKLFFSLFKKILNVSNFSENNIFMKKFNIPLTIIQCNMFLDHNICLIYQIVIHDFKNILPK